MGFEWNSTAPHVTLTLLITASSVKRGGGNGAVGEIEIQILDAQQGHVTIIISMWSTRSTRYELRLLRRGFCPRAAWFPSDRSYKQPHFLSLRLMRKEEKGHRQLDLWVQEIDQKTIGSLPQTI